MASFSRRDLELVSAYLDGELSEAERQQVEKLLAGSDSLRQVLDELRRVRHLVRSLPRAEIQSQLKRKVLRQLKRAKRKKRLKVLLLRSVCAPVLRRLREVSEASLAEEQLTPEKLAQKPARQASTQFFGELLRRLRNPRVWVWPAAAVAVAFLVSLWTAVEKGEPDALSLHSSTLAHRDTLHEPAPAPRAPESLSLGLLAPRSGVWELARMGGHEVPAIEEGARLGQFPEAPAPAEAPAPEGVAAWDIRAGAGGQPAAQPPGTPPEAFGAARRSLQAELPFQRLREAPQPVGTHQVPVEKVDRSAAISRGLMTLSVHVKDVGRSAEQLYRLASQFGIVCRPDGHPVDEPNEPAHSVRQAPAFAPSRRHTIIAESRLETAQSETPSVEGAREAGGSRTLSPKEPLAPAEGLRELAVEVVAHPDSLAHFVEAWLEAEENPVIEAVEAEAEARRLPLYRFLVKRLLRERGQEAQDAGGLAAAPLPGQPAEKISDTSAPGLRLGVPDRGTRAPRTSPPPQGLTTDPRPAVSVRVASGALAAEEEAATSTAAQRVDVPGQEREIPPAGEELFILRIRLKAID